MVRKLRLPDGVLVYDWEKKGVKNLNLRLRPDGTAAVSAPPRVTAEQVEEFLLSKADWLVRARARQSARRQTMGEDAVYFMGVRLAVRTETGEREGARISGGELVIRLRAAADGEKRRALVRAALEQAGAPVLEDSLRRMFELVRPLGVAFPVMTTRWAQGRWGSCSSGRGRISINKALACAPPRCVDYVLLHELVHFLHPDHSPAFYAELAGLMPDYRAREIELRGYSPRF